MPAVDLSPKSIILQRAAAHICTVWLCWFIIGLALVGGFVPAVDLSIMLQRRNKYCGSYLRSIFLQVISRSPSVSLFIYISQVLDYDQFTLIVSSQSTY